MTEEITSRLVGIAGLGVISRTSAMQYKRTEKSLSQIGKELGVNYVLEGSIRWAKTGGHPRVRITPRLIRVSDDRNMWADNYEREMMEVFAVQEDIATKIASELNLALLDSERKELAARPTSNSRAYDYYLKGINELRLEGMGSPFVAAANLDSAVMLDSAFALAHAARSRAYTMIASTDREGSNATIARTSFEKALELQPDLSFGHMAAGIYYNFVEEDYDKSLAALESAVSELHSDAVLLTSIALVPWRKGMIREAGENFAKACELDPLNPAVHDWRSGFLVFTGMYAEAEQSINRAIALNPKNPGYYASKVNLYFTGYADWNKNREVVKEALKHLDTATLVSVMIPTMTVLGGLDEDSLLGFSADLYERIADSVHRTHGKMVDSIRIVQRQAPETVELGESWGYLALSELYRASDNVALAKEYLDSSKSALKSYVGKVPTDFHAVSQFGLLLAKSNMCEEAIEYGARGKELLSIDECHW